MLNYANYALCSDSAIMPKSNAGIIGLAQLSDPPPQLWAWYDATRDVVVSRLARLGRAPRAHYLSASCCLTRSWTSASTRYARPSDTAALLTDNIATIELILSNLWLQQGSPARSPPRVLAFHSLARGHPGSLLLCS